MWLPYPIEFLRDVIFADAQNPGLYFWESFVINPCAPYVLLAIHNASLHIHDVAIIIVAASVAKANCRLIGSFNSSG